MNAFVGTFANLAGMTVGRFRIDQLTGRDKAGAPRWRVICGVCYLPQTLPHAKLANLVQGKHSQASLLCANPACPLSHHERQVETITDLRRQERRENREAEEAALEARLAAESLAAKQRLNDAKFADLQTQYREYWLHQIKTTIEEAEIASLARWSKLSDGTRKAVLDAIASDATLQVRF